MKRRLRRLVGSASRLAVQLAGRAFVRGSRVSDAVAVCGQLAARGRTATIGYFNAQGESPRAVADASLAALQALDGGPSSRATYLSIKAPALRYDTALVGEIVDRARELRVGVHFDSHAVADADATFDVIAASHGRAQGAVDPTRWTLGGTLPGRWRRSLDDAERAIELGLRVRVVKGQWLDPSAPDLDPRVGFMALIDRLAGRAREVAVASHDAPLAREAVRRLQRAGTPVELELLRGLPSRAALKIARELGVAVRVYVPFGVSWVPYALDHVQNHPYVALWALRDATIDRFVTPPLLGQMRAD